MHPFDLLNIIKNGTDLIGMYANGSTAISNDDCIQICEVVTDAIKKVVSGKKYHATHSKLRERLYGKE